MKYVIGIDGGGTGSVLKILSVAGEGLLGKEGGPTNLSAQSEEEVKRHITDLIAGSIKDTGLETKDCQAVCMGAAGADGDLNRGIIRSFIRETGINGKITIKNDAEIGLVAGTGKQEGIIIIAGTGSIGYGRNSRGKALRAGGWGHLVGDEGSGYYIATKALNAALKSYDGRAETTILLPMLLKALELDDVKGLIEYIYSNITCKDKLADLAKIVDDAYKEGDTLAKQILDDSAYELFLLADTLIRQLEFEDEINIVVHGGVLIKNNYIFDTFSSLVKEKHNKAKIVKLNKSAAYGAAIIALEAIE